MRILIFTLLSFLIFTQAHANVPEVCWLNNTSTPQAPLIVFIKTKDISKEQLLSTLEFITIGSPNILTTGLIVKESSDIILVSIRPGYIGANESVQEFKNKIDKQVALIRLQPGVSFIGCDGGLEGGISIGN